MEIKVEEACHTTDLATSTVRVKQTSHLPELELLLFVMGERLIGV